MGFGEYSDISFRAYINSVKQSDTTTRKKEIIDSVLSTYRSPINTLLCVGFNPAVLLMPDHVQITFTQIGKSAADWVRQARDSVEVVSWDELSLGQTAYDLVIAADEFLTFAENDIEQQNTLAKLCGLCSGIMITTLRDYKNLDFKDREFSTPALVRTQDDPLIFLEHHEYDPTDRNAWSRTVYEIQDTRLVKYGRFMCRNMFFKQCAKFSIDAGAREFLVHNNIMYKSMVKKNYEHVISMRFDHNGYFQSSR
jgi:hypothetical protein